jgi:hypothetical protein
MSLPDLRISGMSVLEAPGGDPIAVRQFRFNYARYHYLITNTRIPSAAARVNDERQPLNRVAQGPSNKYWTLYVRVILG